jgi:lipid-binding SYLF domain-containing protein
VYKLYVRLVAVLAFASRSLPEEEVNMIWTKKLAHALVALALAAQASRAQSVEENTVEAASEVLREIMAIPANCIPESMLAEAQAVAIIPGMVKGAFVVGVRHGKGVLVTRDASGAWRAPVFISVTGGSIGWQAGVESTDVVAIFRNRRGVDWLMRGKLTLGADVAVAAGPVGRQASAATDAMLKAEIYSYSRSRGLFAGLALDGAAMLVNHRADAAYYAPRPGLPKDAVPASAIKLVEQIAAYAGPSHRAAVNVKETPLFLPQADDVEALRAQLAESSLRLHRILDPQWKEFLALPGEFYAEGKTPTKEAFDRCLARYGAISKDARYHELSARVEYQETFSLLQRYHSAVEGRASTLKLPPPPQ